MPTNSTKSIIKAFVRKLVFALFWLCLWQLAAIKISNKILLVAPTEVFSVLARLVFTAPFWSSVAFSFSRIMLGFFVAAAAGIAMAVCASQSRTFRDLIDPLLTVIKVTPVASFIILALLWIKPAGLTAFTSFLMVLPIIYANTYQGIVSMDKKLGEMALVFRVPLLRKIRYVFLPQVLPFIISGCSVGLGFCWKAGIAAEVIAQPNTSIGDKLYRAKIYLETPELFAWTAVIIIISLLFEKIFLSLIKRFEAASKAGEPND